MPADPLLLQRLRSRISAIERGDTGSPHTGDSLAFGLPDLDEHLPWGGLATGAVHEILDGDPRTNSKTGCLNGAVTSFTAALAGRAQTARASPIVWIAPRSNARESLYGPGLTAFGLDPAHLIAVRVPTGGEFATTALWAMEEALRATSVGIVCAEIEQLDLTASRRLQLAAEAGGGLGLLLRRDSKHADENALSPTASVSRWRIASLPAAPARVAGAEIANLPGPARWQAELLRARGGQPKTWQLEWRDDANEDHDTSGGNTAGGFAVVSPLRDRPLPETDQGASPSAIPVTAEARQSA